MVPKIIVLAGPGGVGKNSVQQALLRAHPESFVMGTKYTTRAKRPGEREGDEFHFLTREAFQSAIDKGEMLEHNEFNGHLYGIPRASIDQALAAGKNPTFSVELNGTKAIRKAYPGKSIAIFLTASPEELLERYMKRGQTETEAKERLAIAQRDEFPMSKEYDAIIENHDGHLAETVAAIAKIIQAD